MPIVKPVMNHPGYTISDEGVLRSPYGRRLAEKPSPLGYHTTILAGRRVQVHRLVLEAFVGPCPPGMECRHLDGDRKRVNWAHVEDA